MGWTRWRQAVVTGTAFSALLGCGEPDGGGTEPSPTPSPGSSSSTGSASESTEETVPGEPAELSRPGAWELVSAEDDPFADERPEWVQCEVGFEVVTTKFEIDTRLCTYAAFVQPLQAAIAEGDEIELLMTVEPPSMPASGTVAIAFGSEVAFETDLPDPSRGDVEGRWIATADVVAGTPLHLNLRDEGLNTYRLASLTVIPR
ncbi:MAG: hypothetical protein AAGF11_22650 [Myxococcota bacterium]